MKHAALMLISILIAGTNATAEEEIRADAWSLEVRGAIGPAISDFIERGIERATSHGARAVILRLDTPGGLDTSMRVIIKAILAAPVPVITFVGPSGARAASAGTFILYASHVAAMAPATNLGAATPIPIGPGMLPKEGDRDRAGDDEEGAEKDEPAPASPSQAMGRKVLNDAIAYIRGLAKLRGRNADWAEKAVREGASLPAEDALEQGVIDLMAENIEDLLVKLDGRTVDVRGEEVTLDTDDWSVATVKPDWRMEFLAVITNPSVAYVLMLLGIYGLLFELYNPGALIPGVVGAISLLLALYAFNVLPVNFAGVALILVGVALMALEVFTPSFGALGLGGIVALATGSIILIDTDVEEFKVSVPVVITISLAASALFLATALLAVRQRRRPVVTGREEMIGAVGAAQESFAASGRIMAHGELWTAHSERPVEAGERLRITAIEGLILEVEPLREED